MSAAPRSNHPDRPFLNLRSPLVIGFLVTFVAAMALALYTNRVWEDYYITYRSSKNLATGQGLVFNVGDRLHTFTSPIGVLLPAVASLMTANSSDTAALWIFRAMSAAALAGGVTLLLSLARKLSYPATALGFLLLVLATDAKMLDFTINGMETGLLLLFVGYTLWALFSSPRRQYLHLGAAWAGLMWSRPDSFLYIGLLAAATWVFNDRSRTGHDRLQLLGLFLKAGIVTTLLYGPWFAWAWWYYGSPVPHTIVAKGAISSTAQVFERLKDGVWRMPWIIWQGKTSAEGAFLPAYYMFPQWPAWMWPFGRGLATIAMVLWLVPKIRLETRVASFAFFGGVAYLSFVPYFPFPWYFPTTAMLAYFALAGALAQLVPLRFAAIRWLAVGTAAIVVAGGVALSIGAARQGKEQQALIETGNRRVIGEWLREHAQPGDTVFMEPLGYIGFFSGLKTFDWPGMSSREVPRAVELLGGNWEDLILYLQPTWLVMRARGEGDLPKVSRLLATYSYERVREFDRFADVEAVDVPGRALLEFDSHFVLYKRRGPLRFDAEKYEIASLFHAGRQRIQGRSMWFAHAPSRMIVPIQPGAKQVTFAYGFADGAESADNGEKPTDGASFEIWLSDGKTRTQLHGRYLNPFLNPDERGLHEITLELPALKHADKARIVLLTRTGNDIAKDWTCWSDPHFE